MQVRLVSPEMAQQLLRFAHEQHPEVVHAWLANRAELLLVRGALGTDAWAELLLQAPLLLLERPEAADGVLVPKRGELQVPLALASLPAEQQVAVVRAALQHWHRKVGCCC